MGVVIAVALCWSTALIVTDLRERRLPDVLTLPAAVLTAVWALSAGQPLSLVGGLGWCLACRLPGWLPGGQRVGGGDAKLALTTGTVAAAAAGAAGWLAALGASGILTLGTLILPGVRQVGTDRLPHGPGMLVATWAVVLAFGTGWW